MRPMLLLFIALFNSILGLSVLFPILAPLGRELGLNEIEIGSLSVAYALAQLAMAQLWGRKSDAWGRKPVMLIGIVGFALSFFAFAGIATLGLSGALDHVPLVALLVATRLAGGALSSATLPTGQAWAADLSGRENRTKAMAIIGAAFGLGIIFGPGIGAGLATLFDHLLAPVYFSASVAVLNAIFVAAILPEPERREARPSGSRGPLLARVWPVLSIALAATVASVAMEQTIAFYYQDRLRLGGTETAQTVGIALLGYGIVAVIAQGVLVRRFSFAPITLVRAGLPIAIAGYVVLIFADNFWSLTGALLLQGLGQGLLLPGVTAATSLAVDDDEQGAVAGLNSSAQALGRVLGPLLGPMLYRLVAHEAPYALSGAVLTAVLAVVLVRPGALGPRPGPSPLATEGPKTEDGGRVAVGSSPPE